MGAESLKVPNTADGGRLLVEEIAFSRWICLIKTTVGTVGL